MCVVFVLMKTLHGPNIGLPTGDPITELSFPIVGIWGEPGLIGAQGQDSRFGGK